MADNEAWGIFGILGLLIFFLASKANAGTQSAFGGFDSSFLSTPTGLLLLGIGSAVLVLMMFIPAEKK